MELGTWITVAILGPGAIAIFVWFVMDVSHLFSSRARRRRHKHLSR